MTALMPLWMMIILILAVFAQLGDVVTTVIGRAQGLTEVNPVPAVIGWPVEYGFKALIWVAVIMVYRNSGPSWQFGSLIIAAFALGAYATYHNVQLLK